MKLYLRIAALVALVAVGTGVSSSLLAGRLFDLHCPSKEREMDDAHEKKRRLFR